MAVCGRRGGAEWSCVPTVRPPIKFNTILRVRHGRENCCGVFTLVRQVLCVHEIRKQCMSVSVARNVVHSTPMRDWRELEAQDEAVAMTRATEEQKFRELRQFQVTRLAEGNEVEVH